ncbi:MAG: TIGR04086 family membrane protein [Bacillota bacterium]
MTLQDKINRLPTIRVHAVVKGTIYALLVSLVFTLLTGLILYFTSLPESSIPSISMIILAVSIFAGGASAGKSAGARGLWQGGLVGLVFFILTILFAFISIPGQLGAGSLLIKGIVCLISGGLGGVLGVSLRK